MIIKMTLFPYILYRDLYYYPGTGRYTVCVVKIMYLDAGI